MILYFALLVLDKTFTKKVNFLQIHKVILSENFLKNEKP